MFMVEMQIAYQGKLRALAIHGPSGCTVETDAPADNEGLGERFSPTDLVATAMGSCALTIMGIAARKQGFAFEGARVTVQKHMTSAPYRRIGRLALRFTMPATLDQGKRRLLEKAAEECPVRRSLHPDIEVQLQFDYPD
jgi:putative redox protein